MENLRNWKPVLVEEAEWARMPETQDLAGEIDYPYCRNVVICR